MFDDIIAAASEKWGVPVSWINAVIQTESSFNPNAYNPNDPGGARGLMQIIAATAQAYGVSDVNQLFDPATNIDIGTHLLADLTARYGNDFQRVYSAYNSGNPNLWQTSAQVAAHVQTAMSNLATWATDNPTSSGAIVALGAVLLYLLARKK